MPMPIGHRLLLAGLGLAGIFLGGCAATTSDDNLWESLGGAPVVTRVVDDFADRLVANPRINEHFVDIDQTRFRDKLVEFLCEISSGPCQYTGDAMHPVHLHMNLDDADFNALVEDLIESMEAFDVPLGAQNRLLAILAPLHFEIVAPPE